MMQRSAEHIDTRPPDNTFPAESAVRGEGPSKLLRELGIPLLFDVVMPIAAYYGLRVAGVGAFLALVLGALPTGGFAMYQIVKHRKADFLALFVLAILVGSVAMSFVAGSARFMLAKESWFMGAIGAGFLGSLLLRRPFAFTIARDLFQRVWASDNDWDSLWERVPRFRRVWRMSTVIWGVGTLLDAAILAVMAYTLPIDLVPVLGSVLHLGSFVALQVITHVYYKRQGVWELLFSGGKEQDIR